MPLLTTEGPVVADEWLTPELWARVAMGIDETLELEVGDFVPVDEKVTEHNLGPDPNLELGG